MFREILFTQWKWSRGYVMLGTLASFAIPMLVLGSLVGHEPGRGEISFLLREVQDRGDWLPYLAAAIGLALGWMSWAADHRMANVYALALPLGRRRYAFLRFLAGGVLMAAPVFGLWVGSLVAISAATIPSGLQSYPTSLTLRFALASLVAFSFFFAVGSLGRRARWVTLVMFVGVLVALGVTSMDFKIFGSKPRPVSPMGHRFGPFGTFTGDWRLVDV